jgi:hypothetical protein
LISLRHQVQHLPKHPHCLCSTTTDVVAPGAGFGRNTRSVKHSQIIDPETKAPAVKNPFLHPKPGVLIVDDMAIDRLLEKGAMFGACHVALVFMSKRLASNAGLSGDEAAKEWAANLVPGVSLIPSGTWGVNRAQEAGCTYCSGG